MNEDQQYLFEFFDKLTDEERANLKFHLKAGTKFATPDWAMPESGCG